MVPKEKAKEILKRQIEAIKELWKKPHFGPDFKKWDRDTQVAIENIFTPSSRHIVDFTSINYILSIWGNNTPESEWDEAYRKGLANARSILESMIEEIEDEYDVQNLLHELLEIHFDDIRPEEWTPSYAGGASRMDFLLKKEGIVIEEKKTRKGLGAKELGEQLIVDIAKYRRHPDCRCLICFAYDPEIRIANPKGIENDLNREHEGLKVIVIIAPKGT